MIIRLLATYIYLFMEVQNAQPLQSNVQRWNFLYQLILAWNTQYYKPVHHPLYIHFLKGWGGGVELLQISLRGNMREFHQRKSLYCISPFPFRFYLLFQKSFYNRETIAAFNFEIHQMFFITPFPSIQLKN